MATDEENRKLSTETAEALLTAIQAQAERWTSPSDLKAMADAYATVKEAMPRPTGRAVMM